MATSSTFQPAQPRSDSEPTPLLVDGDRLTLAEFERRYDAMPEVKKAELIEGVVYRGSPVRHDQHGKPHIRIGGWLVHYEAATPGVEAGDNGSVILDPQNMPQPDCFLFVKPEFEGQAHVNAKGYVSGSPELVAEISANTKKLDLGDKFKVYRRNGVREYVVWRVVDRQIDWFILRDGDYVPLTPGPDGILRSEVFPGLWLDPAAMLNGDLATVFRTLDEGIRSPEHAAFVASRG